MIIVLVILEERRTRIILQEFMLLYSTYITVHHSQHHTENVEGFDMLSLRISLQLMENMGRKLKGKVYVKGCVFNLCW